MQKCVSVDSLRAALEELNEAAQGCGTFDSTAAAYDLLDRFLSDRLAFMNNSAPIMSDLISRNYDLPDRPVPNLSHALRAARRWNPMDEGVARHAQTLRLFLEAMERATIENLSIFGTVKESMTVRGPLRDGVSAAAAPADKVTISAALDDDTIAAIANQHFNAAAREWLLREKSPPMFPQATYDAPTYALQEFVKGILSAALAQGGGNGR